MSALETIMSGGCWSEARVQHFIRPAQVPVCGKCGEPATDDLHAFWTCPGLRSLGQPEIASTQRMIAAAVAESEEMPCLWLRGIAPHVEQDPRFAPTDELELQPHGEVPNRPWPGGKYWTDGSGGEHGSIPILRRCGCGIATMTVRQEGDRLIISRSWAVYFALPGSIQTVPRSELQAILVVLQNVEVWLPVDIASDSLVNVALFLKGPRFTRNAANPDLWQQVWEAVRLRTADTIVRWIRSHTGPKEISAGEISELDSKGNEWADRMADRAAELAKVPELYAAPALARQAQVQQIQQRLVAVLMTHGKRASTKPRAERAGRAECSSEGSPHCLVEVSSQHWWCSECLAYSPKTLAARKRWMSKCSGRLWVEGKPSNLVPERANQVDKGFHLSHHLGSHRGLFYCTACGAYGSQKARKLTSPCGQPQPGTQPKQHWLYAVARIQKGLLPSGLRCWPEEQAPAAESTVVGFQDWLLQRRSKLLTGPAADSHEAPTAAEKKARRQYMKEVTLQSRWSAVMEQDPGRAAARQATRPAAVSSSLGRQPVEEDEYSAAVQLPVLKVVRKKAGGRAASSSSGSQSQQPQPPQQPPPEQAPEASSQSQADWDGLWWSGLVL